MAGEKSLRLVENTHVTGRVSLTQPETTLAHGVQQKGQVRNRWAAAFQREKVFN
jgi:RES domain-containing protein